MHLTVPVQMTKEASFAPSWIERRLADLIGGAGMGFLLKRPSLRRGAAQPGQ